jgi:hypothetical protein
MRNLLTKTTPLGDNTISGRICTAAGNTWKQCPLLGYSLVYILKSTLMKAVIFQAAQEF